MFENGNVAMVTAVGDEMLTYQDSCITYSNAPLEKKPPVGSNDWKMANTSIPVCSCDLRSSELICVCRYLEAPTQTLDAIEKRAAPMMSGKNISVRHLNSHSGLASGLGPGTNSSINTGLQKAIFLTAVKKEFLLHVLRPFLKRYVVQ